MKYYKLLQLEREPFSNSPDPNYFFQSRQHLACLQKVELAVRLKRGLNVIVGHMGTGKTTLCRELIRRLALEEEFDTYLILDPAFSDSREFLDALYELFYHAKAPQDSSVLDLKEAVKQILFTKGVDQQHTVVLIIDEGQKITSPCVEILRELLNYETNEFKLLQIVIFAQNEFEEVLERHPNFTDRINVLHHLEPMGYTDTCRMIRHRLKLASTTPRPLDMFTRPALWAIYRASRGYPRRIIHLCHQSVLTMIIQNRSKAGWRLIQSCSRRMAPSLHTAPKPLRPGTAVVVTAALLLVLLAPFYWFHLTKNDDSKRIFKIPSQLPQQSITNVTRPPHSPAPPLPRINPVPDPKQPDLGAPVNQEAIAAQTDIRSHQDQQPAAELSLAGDSNGLVDSLAPTNESTDAKRPYIESKNMEKCASPKLQPPDSIGRLTVHSGDTLSGMIITVYGTFRNEYLQSVLNANPHIQDPDNIQLGDAIQLPAMEFELKPTTTACHWVIMGTSDDLEQAIYLSASLSDRNGIPTRPLAVWSPINGLGFEIVLQGYFTSRQAAERYIERLPTSLREKVTAISGWSEGTRLYSDPYAGGIRKPSTTNEA